MKIKILLAAYCLWNLIVFLMYGIDKRKARKDKWRISEKTLLLSAFLMGGIGAFLGMKSFHHKTLHTSFRIIVPLSAVLNIALVAYAIIKLKG